MSEVAVKVQCEKCGRVFQTTTASRLVEMWRTTDTEPFKVPSSWCCTEEGRFTSSERIPPPIDKSGTVTKKFDIAKKGPR